MEIDKLNKYVVIEDDTCQVVLCPRKEESSLIHRGIKFALQNGVQEFGEAFSNLYVILNVMLIIQRLIGLRIIEG